MKIQFRKLVFAIILAAGLPFIVVAGSSVSAQIPPGQQVFTSGFEGDPLNRAPTLDTIDAQVVDLGSMLDLQLSGSDPDGGLLFFLAIPMPDNATLDALSGEFFFFPDEGQVGDTILTFLISDGDLFDSEEVTITVNPAPPDGITMLSGRILDTQDFVADGTETPVDGALVSLLGTGISALTGIDGTFVLNDIPAGAQIFDIDPAGAVAPDGSDYAGFRESLQIIANVDNHHVRPFFLPRIDMDSITPVNPDETTVVMNPNIGAELVVDPHSAFSGGDEFEDSLSISEVPGAVAPAALPPELGFGMLITIQPVGVVFNTPAPLTLPNTDNLPPGSELNLWSLDPATGTFIIVGTGVVSPDGSVIETVSGGVMAADWHGFLPPEPEGEPKKSGCRCKKKCCDKVTGSSTSVSSGVLSEAHSLASYRSLSVNRAPTLVYNSDTADPRPLIVSHPVVPLEAAVPNMLSSHLSVAGVDMGISLFTDTSGLNESVDETIRHVVQFDATALPSGAYPYQLAMTSHYDMSTVGAFIDDVVLVDNRVDSPFGAGWSLAGLNRLDEQFDLSMLLSEGDGSLIRFRPQFRGDGTFTGTRSYAVGPNPLNVVTGDFNNDTHIDFATVNGFFSAQVDSPDALDIFLNDGNGDFTLTRVELPTFPIRVAAGDIDSNTHVDFVITDGTRLRKVLADGLGGWLAPELIPRDGIDSAIRNGLGIVLAKLNADDHLDIAFPNYDQNDPVNHIDVMLSNGPGSWDFAVQVEVGNDPQDLVAGHFNADLFVDLATPNSGSDDITILLGDGSGGFTAGTPLTPNPNPSDLEVADFDNDSIDDLAVAHTGTTGQIVIFSGDGSGAFTEVADFGQGTLASARIATGHFNADFNLDLAALHHTSRSVSVFLGNGTGSFPFNSQYNVATNNIFIAAADTDGDGADDVLTSGGSQAASNISLLRGNGDGSLADTRRIAMAGSGQFLDHGDFNSDGEMDILARAGNGFEVILMGADGELSGGAFTVHCNNSLQVAVADFDGDGNLDIASPCAVGDDFAMGYGDGAGGLDNDHDVPVRCGVGEQACDPLNAVACDFDRDGDMDWVYTKRLASNPEEVQVMINEGARNYTRGAEVEIGDTPDRIRCGDVNGDSFPDVLLADVTDKVKVILNDGAGGMLAPASFIVGDEPGDVRLGLINNDEHVDFAVTAQESDDITLGFGDGAGNFAVQPPLSVEVWLQGAENPEELVLSDLDGDGRDDIAVTIPASHDILILLNDGNGAFSPGGRYTMDTRPLSIDALDLNNDGVVELVATGTNQSNLSIVTGNPTLDVIAYRSPRGEFSSLILNADDSITRRHRNGDEEQYDTDGLMTEVSDRNGNTAVFDYDGQDRLVMITDPAGLETTFTYSGDLISGITDPALRTTTFRHDGAGNLDLILDPDGTGRSFGYDARHHMIAQTSQRGFLTAYTYDTAGANVQVTLPDASTNLIAPADTVGYFSPLSGVGTQVSPAPVVRPEDVISVFTDGKGNDTVYRSGPFGATTSTTDPLLRTTTVSRDMHGNPVTLEQPNGAVTRIGYDARGNVLSVTEAAGTGLERQALFNYDTVYSQVTSMTDFAGKTTIYQYDSNGNLLKSTDPLGGERDFTHTGQGLLASFEDENNHSTTFTYDAKGNLEQATDPLTNVITFARDAAGNISSMTEGMGSPEQRTRTWSYDALNRIEAHQNGEAESTLYRYDLEGNPIELENGNGEILIISFDERSRPVEINDPVTGITSYDWDASGNVIETMDELGNATTREYDAADQLTMLTDAELGEYLFTYDPSGNLETLRDPNSNVTTFDFDLLDRQVELENALTQVYSYTYDAMDNLLTVLDPETQLITNTYDDLSRLTQVSTADNTITYSYDDAGNLLSAADNDSSLLFTWDALNRLETAETVDVGVQPNIVVTNTWDPVGNRSDLSDSAGGAYGYSYDGAGRLIEASSTLAGATILGYDPASRLAQVLYPNGTEINYGFDVLGRLASIEHKETLGPVIELFDYMQNAIGNIMEIDDQSQVTTVAYDDLDQVISAGTAGFPETYSYDSLGNRITSHLSAIHVHNAANQLLEDDEFTYTYDGNGNLATRTRKSDMEVATFTWNAQDHLTGFDFPAEGPAVAYRYDALGRRIEKDVGGTVTRYVYDSLDILLEYNGSNVLQARYGHGELIDQPLFMERGGQAYYYLSDHLGSVTALTDSLGASVNQYSYDAYGRRLAGTMESVLSPFSFTGREFDAESGHYFYRARYYDPQAGRFLSPDPLGFAAQDGNLYRYVHSNPVNRLDPLGLLEETTLRIKDTKTASALDILGEVGKTLLQSVVPKSKGPLAFGELGGRIGIAIYDAFTDSEKLSGELDVKDFHNSRNLRIRVAVREVLRGKNINCLDTLKPPVRKALRDAAKDRLADVLDELGKSKKALRESFNRGGDRGLRGDLRDQIKNLQQERDFLNEAAYGKPVLGE